MAETKHEARNVLDNLPEVDFVLHIQWLVIVSKSSEIRGIEPPKEHALLNDMSHMMEEATQHGRVDFVESVDAYNTKSKVINSVKELVLRIFNTSKFAQKRKTILLLTKNAKHIKHTPKNEKTTVMTIVDEKQNERHFQMSLANYNVYKSFWTVHHPVTEYMDAFQPEQSQVTDPQELILLLTTGFSTEKGNEAASRHRQALECLLSCE